MAKRRKKQSGLAKALRFSKAIVLAIFILLSVYVIAVLVIFMITGSEPIALTENLFGFFSAEGGFLAIIKVTENIAEHFINKNKKKKRGTKES